MYSVEQINSDGTIIYPVTNPMTFLQAIEWIEEVKEKWLLPDANPRYRSNPPSVKFYIRKQTKKDIIDKLKDVPDDFHYWTKIFTWIDMSADFEEYWEDYV